MRELPPAGAASAEDELEAMSLLHHLEELRRRVFRALGVYAAAFLVCWLVHREIFDFLRRPIEPHLPDGKLSFFAVSEPFLLYFKTAALAALFLSSPWLLWEVWGFISPGLYKKEKRWAIPFVFSTSFFFIAGGAFAYYVAFPFAVDFLLEMGQDFDPVIAANSYLRFLMTVILGLGLMFELPVVLFLLSALGLVTPQFLLKHFRWAVLLIFIAAAIITPTPDIVNLCLFALPTVALYLLGVGASFLVYKKREKVKEEDDSANSGIEK